MASNKRIIKTGSTFSDRGKEQTRAEKKREEIESAMTDHHGEHQEEEINKIGDGTKCFGGVVSEELIEFR